MASPPPATEATGDTILFRPSKKRKIYRRRNTADEDEDEGQASSPAEEVVKEPQSIDELIASSSSLVAEHEAVESTTVSMAEILRLRNLTKKKKRIGGVEFRAIENARDDGGASLVLHGNGEGGEEGAVDKVVRRFAPQTGIGGTRGGEVDRHM
jgi:hypothetical protein